MRIVEACFTPALGGLELYCLNSARHLQDRGHQVQLWLAEGGRAANHPITSEIDTLLFCEPFYFDPGFLYRARRILQEQNIDVVHLHRTKDLGALSWIGGIAYILTLQIDSTRQKKDLYHRFVFSRAAKLLTITNRMKRLAESNLGIRAEKIHTLYHGIDSAALSLRRDKDRSLRGSMGIPAEAVVFGIIGRLEWGKGQWALLKALKQIYDKYPNAHLLIVGEPPPEGAGFDTELKRMAEEMGIADRTHFTGFLMDTAEAYSAMDVCVLASKKESFGLVLLEAMAFGLPIIATDAGGVPEIIEPGVNGLLVKPEDSQNLAEAMVCLL
ncbi:MAG: glycosyltransferase family 4 protein, partial [bacterium]